MNLWWHNNKSELLLAPLVRLRHVHLWHLGDHSYASLSCMLMALFWDVEGGEEEGC